MRKADSFVARPATAPSKVFDTTGPQSRGFVSPTIVSSAGVPYCTESDVIPLRNSVVVAIPPRLA